MIKYNDDTLYRIAEVLKILAEPLRLKIIQNLCEGTELSVSEILEKTGGQQANISKHLGILRRSGLVLSRKEGLNVYYRLRDTNIFCICDSICSHLKCKLDQERSLFPD